jgi:ABC-type multidrug transport system fused ATPase/permease subunit
MRSHAEYDPSNLPSLQIQNVAQRYGRRLVLANIPPTVRPGLTLLVGPAGAGKSTMPTSRGPAPAPLCSYPPA